SWLLCRVGHLMQASDISADISSQRPTEFQRYPGLPVELLARCCSPAMLGLALPLSPSERRRMIALLTLVFVVSGAAGLIYESIWSRYLSLLVGHSAYAQIIVLVIFLGGMSLGALVVGQRSERLRQPLLWYATIEAAVGVIGLGFNYVYVDISDAAYDTIFPMLAGGWALVVVKWLIAALM